MARAFLLLALMALAGCAGHTGPVDATLVIHNHTGQTVPFDARVLARDDAPLATWEGSVPAGQSAKRVATLPVEDLGQFQVDLGGAANAHVAYGVHGGCTSAKPVVLELTLRPDGREGKITCDVRPVSGFGRDGGGATAGP